MCARKKANKQEWMKERRTSKSNIPTIAPETLCALCTGPLFDAESSRFQPSSPTRHPRPWLLHCRPLLYAAPAITLSIVTLYINHSLTQLTLETLFLMDEVTQASALLFTSHRWSQICSLFVISVGWYGFHGPAKISSSVDGAVDRRLSMSSPRVFELRIPPKQINSTKAWFISKS